MKETMRAPIPAEAENAAPNALAITKETLDAKGRETLMVLLNKLR